MVERQYELPHCACMTPHIQGTRVLKQQCGRCRWWGVCQLSSECKQLHWPAARWRLTVKHAILQTAQRKLQHTHGLALGSLILQKHPLCTTFSRIDREFGYRVGVAAMPRRAVAIRHTCARAHVTGHEPARAARYHHDVTIHLVIILRHKAVLLIFCASS